MVYKDLISVGDLTAGEITLILDTAVSMKEVSTREIKKVPTLRGKTVINLFFEPSTRTRTSFEIAGKRLSADVVNIFDQENQRVIARKDTFQVPLYVQDVLSAFYYVRTQNIQIGKHFSVDNFSDGKNYPLEVKVLKKENVRVQAGKFSCFVVEPILKSTGIFKQKGRLKVWMTEDPTHTPVLMKSEIVVGSIVAELIEYRGVNPIKQ